MILWPARVVTPEATYDPCHYRQEGDTGEVLDKQGVVLATLPNVERALVYEAGEGKVRQRWQVRSGEVRWVAELTGGCGCGGTQTKDTDPAELAW